MVLTVTLNPLLERRLVYSSIKTGTENRTEQECFSAGGKGINVSRQLKNLDVPNNALTFIGGNNGRTLRHLITQEGINVSFSQTRNETRQAVLVKDESAGRLTTFFGPNSTPDQAEIEDFKTKMKKMIETCQIVVFSGSSPSPLSDEIFSYGIQLAHELDRISVCDTYGSTLKKCIDAAPTIIHNNISETERSLGISLDSEEKILSYMSELYASGIKQVYLTNGPAPVYSSNFGFFYKADMPEITELDATGSGDAFTAGLVFGLYNSLTFEESLRSAAALGCANAASWEICSVKPEQAGAYSDKIRVSTIGKKINTLQI